MAQVYDELASNYQLVGRTDINPWMRRLFVKNTLAQTAHFIVHNVIRSHRIKPLDDLDIYQAARSSFRGGICQVFSNELYTNDELSLQGKYIPHLVGVDANSLYPSVMSKHAFIGYLDQYEKYDTPIKICMRSNLDTKELYSIYGLYSFTLPECFSYGFIPVKSPKHQRTFYPLSWNVGNVYKDKTIFGENLVWVWGFQLQTIMDIASKYKQRKDVQLEYLARAYGSNQLYIG